jgi:hypothetical protein
MMKLSEALALALLVLALAIVFVSGRVLAAPDDKAKALAAEAAGDETAIKRLQGEEARKAAEFQRVRAAQSKREELLRRCKVKPVMTDGEIEACRVAYREVGEMTKN